MSEGTEEAPRELISEQLDQVKALEKELEELRGTHAPDDEVFLSKALEVLDLWIQLYWLDKMEDLIAEVQEACVAAGGDFKIKILQSKSFMKWKQYKFREALDIMLEVDKLIGPSPFHYENMAHTYNSLQQFEEAERYFRLALMCKTTNQGGVLLGLATLYRRQSKFQESKEHAEQALEVHRKAAKGQPTSLVAKTLTALAKTLEDMGDHATAEGHWREAVKLFTVTTGADSPLTAGAYTGLGNNLIIARNTNEAPDVMRRALEATAHADTCHLPTLCELMTNIKTLHTTLRRYRPPDVARYVPGIGIAVDAIKRTKQEDSDDAAVFYKYAGELLLLARHGARARPLLLKSRAHLAKVTSIDVTGLIKEIDSLIPFCDATYAADRPHDDDDDDDEDEDDQPEDERAEPAAE